MIPFLDLKAPYLELKQELDEAIARVVSSGWFIGGGEVDQFEEDYATYCGANHAIGVANGLDALHLALRAMGVGPGDEVIVPSNTYIATWLAVSQCGATPVPVEPDARTYNIDPALARAVVKNLVESRTQGIPYWGTGQIHLAGLERTVAAQRSVGAITGEVDLMKIIDTRFLDEDIRALVR